VNQGTRMGSIAGSRANEVGTGRECRDVEVSSLSQRRRLTAAYQRRVWAEAEACTAPGQVDALLRREGLSASHLTTWRRPCEPGVLEGPDAAQTRPQGPGSGPTGPTGGATRTRPCAPEPSAQTG
jgi:hypothetical protein